MSWSQKGGEYHMTAQQKLREHIKEVAEWRKTGMTKKEIAKRLNLAVNTMYRAAKADEQIAKVLFGEEYTSKKEMAVGKPEQKAQEKDTALRKYDAMTSEETQIQLEHEDITEALQEEVIEEKAKTKHCICQGLQKRCTGYRATVTKHYKVKRPFLDKNGMPILDGAKRQVMTEELVEVKEVQDIPPDLDAIKFFLMNQEKETWKIDPERIRQEGKKTDIEHTKSFEKWLQEMEEMEETEEMEHEE